MLVSPNGAAAPRVTRVYEETTMAQTSQTYTVTGMTCGHCVSAVTEEARGVPGVSEVLVDLDTGALTVTADDPIADEAVAAAVDEAGYALAR